MGVPYVPVVGLVGTDLLKRRDDMVVAVDPFDGKTLSRGGEGDAARTWRCFTRRRRTGRATCPAATTPRR